MRAHRIRKSPRQSGRPLPDPRPAIDVLAGSADIGSVASLMGHLDASMILNTYQHVQDTQKRAAVEAAPDILGLAGSTRAKRLPGI